MATSYQSAAGISVTWLSLLETPGTAARMIVAAVFWARCQFLTYLISFHLCGNPVRETLS